MLLTDIQDTDYLIADFQQLNNSATKSLSK